MVPVAESLAAIRADVNEMTSINKEIADIFLNMQATFENLMKKLQEIKEARRHPTPDPQQQQKQDLHNSDPGSGATSAVAGEIGAPAASSLPAPSFSSGSPQQEAAETRPQEGRRHAFVVTTPPTRTPAPRAASAAASLLKNDKRGRRRLRRGSPCGQTGKLGFAAVRPGRRQRPDRDKGSSRISRLRRICPHRRCSSGCSVGHRSRRPSLLWSLRRRPPLHRPLAPLVAPGRRRRHPGHLRPCRSRRRSVFPRRGHHRARVYNLAASPAILPLSAVRQAEADLRELLDEISAAESAVAQAAVAASAQAAAAAQATAAGSVESSLTTAGPRHLRPSRRLRPGHLRRVAVVAAAPLAARSTCWSARSHPPRASYAPESRRRRGRPEPPPPPPESPRFSFRRPPPLVA